MIAHAPEAILLAVAAAVRHRFTRYDELLMRGTEPHDARALVAPAVEEKLARWARVEERKQE